MTPHKLTLMNFTGIRAGQGMNEITIDLDEVAATGDTEVQLILLKGGNGSGKTTILDNLHPYRLMPSRASGYSPGGFSYYDHTYGDAEKILEWSHDGNRYRTHLVIKGAGKAKKTEAYLQTITFAPIGDDGGTDETIAPVRLPDGTISDGKTATYDACLEAILGTPEMFFTAAFSSQGRRQLSSYSNADIKSLMAELLSLDDITALGEKAAAVTKLLTGRVDAMRDQHLAIQAKQQTRDTFLLEREAAVALLSETQAEIEQAQAAAESADLALKESERLQSDVAEAARKRAAIEQDQAKVRDAALEREREIQHDIRQEQERAAGARRRYDHAVLDVQARIAAAERIVADSTIMIDRRDEILAAVDRAASIDAELEAAESAGATAKAAHEQMKAVSATRREVESAVVMCINRITLISGDIKRLAESARLVDDVPCAGTDLQDRCQLLASAVDARRSIPQSESDRADAEHDLMQAEQALAAAVAEIEPLSSAEQNLEECRGRYKALQEERAKVASVAALQRSLDVAASNAEAAEYERDRLVAGLQESEAEQERLLADINKRIADLRERMEIMKQGAAQQIAQFQAEIDQIPAGDTSALDAALKAHQGAQERHAGALDQGMQVKARVAAYDERIAVISRELLGADALADNIDRLAAEIAEWQLLRTALGRDGITALCIDDAGPTLASVANQLLLSCYGPRFSVSIQTQAETAAGSTREIFDIRVFDGERDDEKSVSAMSGGERIYINEALTRAIALYQASQSGQTYGTLFADESDGALDPERKVMFTNMKRKVLEIGGYEREIFITHTPELHDLADVVIDLDKMKSA